MQANSPSPKKPLSEEIRPELTRLPRLTPWRRLFRRVLSGLARLGVALLTRAEVRGLEHFPRRGPALVVVNHLGDADPALGLAFFPVLIDTLAKAELYDYPVLGMIMDMYGVIWVHRGQPDRRALRVVLQTFQEGRIVGIAPEGRESLTGSLEEGTGGAAYLALKAGVPVVPVTFTGTENARIYGNLKRLRRTRVSMTVGPAFYLDNFPDRRQSVQAGTDQIMMALASQLPPEYRGVYQQAEKDME